MALQNSLEYKLAKKVNDLINMSKAFDNILKNHSTEQYKLLGEQKIQQRSLITYFIRTIILYIYVINNQQNSAFSSVSTGITIQVNEVQTFQSLISDHLFID